MPAVAAVYPIYCVGDSAATPWRGVDYGRGRHVD